MHVRSQLQMIKLQGKNHQAKARICKYTRQILRSRLQSKSRGKQRIAQMHIMVG